jgi:predicted HAD superfamily Cof-like phosphohydrolase
MNEDFEKFTTFYSYVREFMIACDQFVTGKKNEEQVKLYEKLIIEEYSEFVDAREDDDKKEMLDGICDTIWVGIGYFISKGETPDNMMIHRKLLDIISIKEVMDIAKQNSFDLDGAMKEVHRSNMSKVDPVTKKVIKREDGKVLKPETFSPPNLEPFL